MGPQTWKVESSLVSWGFALGLCCPPPSVLQGDTTSALHIASRERRAAGLLERSVSEQTNYTGSAGPVSKEVAIANEPDQRFSRNLGQQNLPTLGSSLSWGRFFLPLIHWSRDKS